MMSGVDSLGRDLIMVYDISGYQNGVSALFTKQISDFPITKLRYLDQANPNTLVSCGKENICFWQLKNKFLTIQPINLNEHAKNLFNWIDVLKQKMVTKKDEQKVSKTCYFVYVVSNLGFLFLIDYNKAEMKTVLKLHTVSFA